MIRRRPERRVRRGNTIVAIIALGTIAALLLGMIATLLPGEDDTDDTRELQDASVRVTPGAEVARLETKVAEDPSDIASMVVLAEVLANSGRVAESIPWFERAIASREDDADLRLAFARTLMRTGGWYDAELQLRAAQERAPENATVAFYLGDLFETRPRPDLDEAKRWYQTAVDLEPDSVVATQAKERLTILGPSDGSPSASPTS